MKKYTEIEVTSGELCPACKNLLRWIILSIMFLFGVPDVTVGIKDKTEDELIGEVENG